MEKPVVIITGCSSGLGLALARHLESLKQYRLVVTAREKSFAKLMELFKSSDEMLLHKLDVTENEQVSQLVNAVTQKWGRIDILINNAGICFRGVVEHMDPESEMIQLKTNYLGPMNLVRSVLPIMREQRGGKIINISSVSGMISMPTMASYSASKQALEGATESLWYEAQPYGIKVCLVEPGFVRSDSFRHVVISKKAELSQKLKGPHSEYYNSITPLIETMMHLSGATPEKIAKRIERIMRDKNPPLRLQVTLDAHVFHILKRWLPARFFHHVMFALLPGSHKWGAKSLDKPVFQSRKSELKKTS